MSRERAIAILKKAEEDLEAIGDFQPSLAAQSIVLTILGAIYEGTIVSLMNHVDIWRTEASARCKGQLN